MNFGFKRSKIVKICANKMINWSHHPKLSTTLTLITHSFEKKWTFCQNTVKKKNCPIDYDLEEMLYRNEAVWTERDGYCFVIGTKITVWG